jgi:hypothetical protein
VRADFDDVSDQDGDVVDTVRVTGSADVDVTVVEAGSGAVLAATGRPGEDRAVNLPGFDPATDGPRAVLRLTNAGDSDDLNPRKRDFSWGADFVLDAASSEPGTSDDGDNLVQRGLFDDDDQYKLQIDGRQPSCRLKGRVPGRTSAVDVTSPVEVDSTHWYGARCVRHGTSLDVIVTKFNDDGTTEVTTTSVSSRHVIKVKMADASVPLSVGGKVNHDGTLQLDSDQFNGLVDNVFLSIG